MAEAPCKSAGGGMWTGCAGEQRDVDGLCKDNEGVWTGCAGRMRCRRSGLPKEMKEACKSKAEGMWMGRLGKRRREKRIKDRQPKKRPHAGCPGRMREAAFVLRRFATKHKRSCFARTSCTAACKVKDKQPVI
eukprot:1159445-Pelagomonas_calceolata.AAC.9